MKITAERVALIWLIVSIAWLSAVAVSLLQPILTPIILKHFTILDSLTSGLASSTLLLFTIPIAITIFYLAKRVNMSRGKTSSVNMAFSTMHESMFREPCEERARRKFDTLKGSPNPHLWIWVPTDKEVDGKIYREVKSG
jgi:hypothetical protein